MINPIKAIRSLFGRPQKAKLTPLLDSNVETLFEEWCEMQKITVPSSHTNRTVCDVVGNYAIQGKNANDTGEGYFGTLALTQSGNLLKAYWEIGHQRAPQFGYGFVKGDLIALDFYYTEEQIRFEGQVIYRFTNDSLTGIWRENHISELALESGILKNKVVNSDR